ncbi:hypothetical protein ACN42_g1759 [Penicillium freii]|uniref:Uncharacterized protein n=1 Tax=Penicillium freii TaxID=48697 RepID=A0A101MRD3_PENFR|nr:hypothetical protein ACN42_g1759 [Penicillium freii]
MYLCGDNSSDPRFHVHQTREIREIRDRGGMGDSLSLFLSQCLSLILLPTLLWDLFLVPPSSSLLIDINFREFRDRNHFVSPTKLLEPLQSSLPHHFPYGPLFLQVNLFSSSSPFFSVVLCLTKGRDDKALSLIPVIL